MMYRQRCLALLLAVVLTSCALPPSVDSSRKRIIVAGHSVPTAGRVVAWRDPGGFSAYTSDGKGHFAMRGERLPPHLQKRVEREGWTFEQLRDYVDLVVIHYDAVGNSRGCFDVLQRRGLSAHFLIDTDGTIYQTLDLKEKAWHATVANDRSIGIEIAQSGAVEEAKRPAQAGDIVGQVQGKWLRQRPFTEAQYDALAKLLAGLADAFPHLRLDYPRTTSGGGAVVQQKLADDELARFRGVIGHFHVQTNKVDPGPAFDWQRVILDAQRYRRGSSALR